MWYLNTLLPANSTKIHSMDKSCSSPQQGSSPSYRQTSSNSQSSIATQQDSKVRMFLYNNKDFLPHTRNRKLFYCLPLIQPLSTFFAIIKEYLLAALHAWSCCMACTNNLTSSSHFYSSQFHTASESQTLISLLIVADSSVHPILGVLLHLTRTIQTALLLYSSHSIPGDLTQQISGSQLLLWL